MATTLPTELRQEIASVKRDIYHPYVGRLLLNMDETLLTRGGARNLKIYDDIERDPHIFSVLQKRKMAIQAYPWVVDPVSQSATDKEVAQLITAQLGKMNFNQACVGLLDAILKGYAVGEIMWIVDGAEIRPQKVIARDQRRFRFDIDYQLRMLTFSNMLEGEELPDRKFIVHSVGSKDGSPYGLGLGTLLFWPAFFKRQDITFWLTFLDKYGSPTSVGKYPPGATTEQQSELLAVLQAIAQDAGVIIPENMQIEFLEATRTGSVDGYERLLRYMDEQASEAVLGETLTTNIGSVGSKAAAETHNGVRLELTQADAELLAAALNGTLVQWIVDLNRPGAPCPQLRWEVKQQEDLAARAERDVNIASMGFEPSEDYINSTYGGEWTKKEMPSPTALLSGGAGGDDEEDPAFAEATAAGSGRALVDAFAAQLDRRASPAISAMVAKVRKLADKEASLEALRDRLIDLYPDISAADFAETMTQALAAANLGGRHEVPRK